MILRRLTGNLRAQNWTAIMIEFLIVVVGVFFGTQVSNWNQQRLEKRATERMLDQFIPELRTQVDYYDATVRYYATTRRYADQAFAGWRSDPTVSDEQFVIAAYQASQISGIGINADTWSITFGGEQLRNLEDPKVRRYLELILTADYTPVEFAAVATRYREQVRHVIPVDIQDAIRRECGDRNTWLKGGSLTFDLPTECKLRIEPAKAASAAAALRARQDLPGELTWHIAAVAAYLSSFESLVVPIRALLRELTATPSASAKAS
jgi:hypothetical protein